MRPGQLPLPEEVHAPLVLLSHLSAVRCAESWLPNSTSMLLCQAETKSASLADRTPHPGDVLGHDGVIDYADSGSAQLVDLADS